MQLKISEKEFREHDARMEEAVGLYATIARHKQEYQQAMMKKTGRPQPTAVTASAATPAPRGTSPAGTKVPPMTRLMQFCKSKMPDIVALMKDHPEDFVFLKNPTLDEDLAIRNECADGPAIIKVIRDSVAARAGSSKKK